MKHVNGICPNCGNPNCMVSLEGCSKAYKYKCINCNGYFNDIDFEKEPLRPAWKSECMNTKVNMVEVVRCKDCMHGEPWGVLIGCGTTKGFGITHNPDWFCADGVAKNAPDKEGR